MCAMIRHSRTANVLLKEAYHDVLQETVHVLPTRSVEKTQRLCIENMTNKPSNVAVVGFGLSAKVFHIPFIQALPEDFTLYGVVQRT